MKINKSGYNPETKVSEVLKELKRERDLRIKFYPNFIRSGKLYKAQADKQQNGLNAAIAVFEKLNQKMFISKVIKNENNQQSLF